MPTETSVGLQPLRNPTPLPWSDRTAGANRRPVLTEDPALAAAMREQALREWRGLTDPRNA